MTQKPLSPKALGLLVQIYLEGAPGGAEGLAKTFSVGVKYVLSGLKELRSMGLVDTIKGKGSNGQFWAELNVTEEGVKFCEDMVNRMPKRSAEPHAILGSSISQNSYLADTPYSKGANSVKRRTNGVRSKKKYKTMEVNVNDFGGTPMDPDDLAELKAKDKKRKQEEKIAAKQAKVDQRAQDRNTRTVEDWTVQDSVSYFAEEVGKFWHLPKYQMDKRTFFFAFKNFHDSYGTNGPIEKEMIDRYILSIKQDTSIVDPEHIWRRFIKMAPSFVADARRASVSDEHLAKVYEEAVNSESRRNL